MIAFAVGTIAFLTLTPVDQVQLNVKLFSLCVLCAQDSIPDALENILLFMPFGFALTYRVRRIWIITSVGALFSLAIELTQFYIYIPGRYPALQDIITNALGSAMGWVVAHSRAGSFLRRAVESCRQSWPRCARPNQTLAGKLALGFTSVAVVMLGLTGWLLSPRIPDGQLVVSTKNANSTDLPVRIGANGEWEGYFKGTLDEIRIYARALSNDEIVADQREPVAGPSARAREGLTAAFGFEESEAKTALDSSGKGNDGILSETVRVPGRFGRGLEFDGSRSVVSIPSVSELTLTDRFTLSAWVCPKLPLGPWPTVIQKGKDDYFLYAGADRVLTPNGGARFGIAADAVEAPLKLQPGKWVHLAVTYDGSSLTLYVDGLRVARLDRWYPGEIQRAVIGSIPLDAGPVASDKLKDALASGQTITLKGVAGLQDARRGALVDIRDGLPGDRALWLASEHSDIILREHTLAQSLGLLSPELRAAGALGDVKSGEAFEASVSGRPGMRTVSVNGSVMAMYGHTVGMGWGIVTESRYLPPWAQQGLAAAWIAAWAFPAGFWSRTLVIRTASLAGIAAALLLVPAATTLAPTPVGQWLAALAGFLAGTLVGRFRSSL